MKHLFLIVVCILLCPLAHAKLEKGKIILKNGKTLKGLVEFPDKGDEGTIGFKENKDSDKLDYPSTDIKTLIFEVKDSEVEFEYVTSYKGLGSKKITNIWLQVVIRGYLSLYMFEKFTRNSNGTFSSERFWYCYRPGEEGASAISWTGSANNNATFKARGPKYFQDYPELAQKIENKLYKWDNLNAVVEEYNKWKRGK